MQGLFFATLTAEGQPAVRSGRPSMPLAFHLMLNQLENPKGEAIIKFGDQ